MRGRCISWVCWLTSVILALGGLRQEDDRGFQVSQGVQNPCLKIPKRNKRGYTSFLCGRFKKYITSLPFLSPPLGGKVWVTTLSELSSRSWWRMHAKYTKPPCQERDLVKRKPGKRFCGFFFFFRVICQNIKMCLLGFSLFFSLTKRIVLLKMAA